MIFKELIILNEDNLKSLQSFLSNFLNAKYVQMNKASSTFKTIRLYETIN